MSYKDVLVKWANTHIRPQGYDACAIDAWVNLDVEYEQGHGGDETAHAIFGVEIVWSTPARRPRTFRSFEYPPSLEQFIEELTGDIDE